jgi:protein TonB
MAYLQHTSWRDRPGAIAGVIAIHALVGYALVNGLSFTEIIDQVKNPQGIQIDEVPITPPPPPKPDPAVEPDQHLATPPIHAPTPPVDLGPQRSPIDTTTLILPTFDIIPKPTPGPLPGPSTRPRTLIPPVGAKPRNDPGGWVTEADYRSSWINREWTGIARFRLEVSASGRVDGCTITGSSGHDELDKATCDLITRRARFDAAKDENGARTGGSYAGSVRWDLPE